MVQHCYQGEREETILYLAEQWPRAGKPQRITKYAEQLVEIEDDDR